MSHWHVVVIRSRCGAMQSLADVIRSRVCPGCGGTAHVLVVSDPDATAWCVSCIEREVRYIEDGEGESTAFVDSYFVFTMMMGGVLRLRRPVAYYDDRFFRYLEALLREFDM